MLMDVAWNISIYAKTEHFYTNVRSLYLAFLVSWIMSNCFSRAALISAQVLGITVGDLGYEIRYQTSALPHSKEAISEQQ